jgi:hypothetical protein
MNGDGVDEPKTGGVDKKKYKMLKAAFKEERDARLQVEVEMQNLVTKYETQAKEFEETKDKNLQLYDRNIELEEQNADMKSIQRATDNSGQSDNEHMKEILGTQNLLREEMKEKEHYKQVAQDSIEKLLSREEELKLLQTTSF